MAKTKKASKLKPSSIKKSKVNKKKVQVYKKPRLEIYDTVQAYAGTLVLPGC